MNTLMEDPSRGAPAEASGERAKDTSHLIAIQERLGHERARLDAAATTQERELRSAWVSQIEREQAEEFKRLGMTPDISEDIAAMSDDELMSVLKGETSMPVIRSHDGNDFPPEGYVDPGTGRVAVLVKNYASSDLNGDAAS